MDTSGLPSRTGSVPDGSMSSFRVDSHDAYELSFSRNEGRVAIGPR